MTIKALLVDDEPLARRLLREFLRPHADIDIIGECDNGADALQALGELTPDLVFLDIQMPQLTGLEVLELSRRDHGVILTTAYDQYALKAFDLHAVDYLLKPFSQARFEQAVSQARKQLQQPQAGLQQLAAQPTLATARLERIAVRDRQQTQLIAFDQLISAEAQDDYINLHTPGRSYLKTQRLSELEAGLDPARFVRVHRSWLINLDHLRAVERGASWVLLMSDGQRVPVSRSGQERLRPLLPD
ncbi:LytTR family DNA-binding domain-containing protein [Paucibacter sp. APW11]|uniref:LytTR family DNA-binding domain-containing protein n=1 Tax=Roseateles aquae TaxID=3077235 RepID=A0ABU3PF17_9BURK|nr:LytTR family DNA-binding domain-containing protein [Paucibacter sp. APW11]MDT9000757.1 LytTR family DNA-binding domain-containing protein [Paucibacter sp. APW11]